MLELTMFSHVKNLHVGVALKVPKPHEQESGKVSGREKGRGKRTGTTYVTRFFFFGQQKPDTRRPRRRFQSGYIRWADVWKKNDATREELEKQKKRTYHSVAILQCRSGVVYVGGSRRHLRTAARGGDG